MDTVKAVTHTHFRDFALHLEFLIKTNLTHSFFLCVYLNSLHVSSNLVLIIRRINCINTGV